MLLFNKRIKYFTSPMTFNILNKIKELYRFISFSCPSKNEIFTDETFLNELESVLKEQNTIIVTM